MVGFGVGIGGCRGCGAAAGGVWCGRGRGFALAGGGGVIGVFWNNWGFLILVGGLGAGLRFFGVWALFRCFIIS